MSFMENHITKINEQGKKALAIFLTAGYPTIKDFPEIALKIIKSGADILEVGIPFSDPLADGPTIQKSSQNVLENGVNVDLTFELISEIRKQSNIPIAIMTYANPVLNYGIDKFVETAIKSGVNGLILPDIPLEEFDSFSANGLSKLDNILLTTPTSSEKRIKQIDEKSSGFLYCVSITGTTGSGNKFNESALNNLKRTYDLVNKNKLLLGFGISSKEDIYKFKTYCDGFIVGSAVVKSLSNEKDLSNPESTLNLIKNLREACN